MFILCHAAKNEPRKRAKGPAFGNRSCAPKLSVLSHLQCFGERLNIQTLRSHFDEKMRTDRAKLFDFPFLFEICVKAGALQVAKTFAVAYCVLLPCWQFPIKLPTQKLNLLVYAKTLEVREHRQFWRCQGSSKRERLGAFLALLLAA